MSIIVVLALLLGFLITKRRRKNGRLALAHELPAETKTFPMMPVSYYEVPEYRRCETLGSGTAEVSGDSRHATFAVGGSNTFEIVGEPVVLEKAVVSTGL